MNYNPYVPQYPTYMPRQDALTGAQNAPQMPQGYGQVNAQPMTQTGFACRPVTSREEAVAALVDYFSPGTLMPDFGHGRIYFKRFNQNTGASDFVEFSVIQQPAAEPEHVSVPDYTESFVALGVQLTEMSERLDAITAKFDEFRQKSTRSVKKSDKLSSDSDTDDAVGA